MGFKKTIGAALLTAALFYVVNKFCHVQTDGFQIVKILSTIPSEEQWQASSLNGEELKEILAKPFHFLDSGGQCYAFLSEDKQVVLKFFKMHHLRQYPWLKKIPLPPLLQKWKNQFLLHQKEKLSRVFSSCAIAWNELKEETGLIGVNLNPNPELSCLQVEIIDKLGIHHHLDLSRTPFVLQYRADNAFQRLRFHLNRLEIESAKQVVEEIVQFMKIRLQKGIKDLDPAPRRNMGLFKGKAIAIDIGAFFHSTLPLSALETKEALATDTRRMRKWLSKRSLELTLHFDSLLESNHLE